jgi:S-adenosylmethionine decarboxylase
VTLGIAVFVSLILYAFAVPWVFTSSAMEVVSGWTAASGGAVLGALGAGAHVTGPVLNTARGGFVVTPECLFTPMIPISLAAILVWPMRLGRRFAWLAVAVPAFFALGVVRLLALALPAFLVDTPAFLAHGFYQVLAGLALIVVAAHLSAPDRSARRASERVIAGVLAAIAAAIVGGLWKDGLLWAAGGVQHVVPATLTSLQRPGEMQGALALLPVYQFGLAVGLWIAMTGGAEALRFARALAWLAVSQVVLLAAIGLYSQHFGAWPHALMIRAWAVGVPVLLTLVWTGAAGTFVGDPTYKRFWQNVGDTFPSLTGATSTRLYARDERRLITDALPHLAGRSVLKTDLWDEAKNTQILQWVCDRGARVTGIDISMPTVIEARDAFGTRTLHAVASDVRRTPFADGSFDAIYSMGTVEHFVETEAAVIELGRLLKPGGRLILGVPNRHDPFLRPAFVALLSRFGLYAYGVEKCYSRKQLRKMLEDAGLSVVQESGILFIPGYLRMADLWVHTRMPALSWMSGALVAPFGWISRLIPALNKHGYLIASVGEKPHALAAASEAVSAGAEIVIDARRCDPAKLRSLEAMQMLFDRILTELNLRPVAAPVWHVFPGEGGITGVVLLAESHLSVHTYPETGLAAINLYCCKQIGDWPWRERLAEALGARDVGVRQVTRG